MLNDSRQDLRKDIGHWRARYHQFFPQVPPHPPADNPEDETLELPSSYNANRLESFGLGTLANLEFTIRLGHAYDAIDDIRTSIHIYNTSSREKRTQLSGQRSGTRAWSILNSIKNDTRECAKRYHLSYSALLTLGLPGDSELKPIREEDLWGRDMALMTKQGESKRKEPWYWVIGKPRDISNGDWELECKSVPYPKPISESYFHQVERVRWFRMRAARDRYREEVEILNEEFRRTYQSFTRMSVIWKKIGDTQFKLHASNPPLASGYHAFASRQAAMYTKLADNTVENWKKARVDIK